MTDMTLATPVPIPSCPETTHLCPNILPCASQSHRAILNREVFNDFAGSQYSERSISFIPSLDVALKRLLASNSVTGGREQHCTIMTATAPYAHSNLLRGHWSN
eukprot:GHUV01021103.1.p1 GENE.GHUV01021103.1~~GHUV01021103.1.p1  ORF type:complete len:104 (+),score=9.27 GHUV01021103.1:844-1155(+)